MQFIIPVNWLQLLLLHFAPFKRFNFQKTYFVWEKLIVIQFVRSHRPFSDIPWHLLYCESESIALVFDAGTRNGRME